VKIQNVDHEFTALPNIKEDVLDIILNIKGLVLRCHSQESKVVTLKSSGEGMVTARDVEHDNEIEIINPDHHIATLNKGGKLQIEMVVESGKGYVPSESIELGKKAIGTIPIDATFSPVVKVNHQVESIRVGKLIDYDKLVLDVWTDGSIKPEDAVKQSSEILKRQLEMFLHPNQKPEISAADAGPDEIDKKKAAGLELNIDDLELSARSSNCLKKAGIETVSELIEKPMSDLMRIKNFGKKSADEINAKLAHYNLSLKMEGMEEFLAAEEKEGEGQE
ncbi:DNA-directed RNA polymerase subunit alpha, partial [Candidatus Margulisiibacteriota bacterium]